MPEIVKNDETKEVSKAEPRKATPVAKGHVRKPTASKKVAKKFLSDDVHNIKDWFIDDLLVPGIKGAIMGALDMALNGGSGYSYTRGDDRRRDRGRRVDYGRPSRERRDERRRETRRDYSPGGWDDEVVIYSSDYRSAQEAKHKAEEILGALDDIIDRYQYARVADLYEFAGISIGNDYTLNNYGWSDIRTAKVVRVRDGWLIDMPRAIPLD